MFIRPLHSTLGFIKSYESVNVKFIEHPQCFTFRIILWFYAILCVFVFYSDYSYTISNENSFVTFIVRCDVYSSEFLSLQVLDMF